MKTSILQSFLLFHKEKGEKKTTIVLFSCFHYNKEHTIIIFISSRAVSELGARFSAGGNWHSYMPYLVWLQIGDAFYF